MIGVDLRLESHRADLTRHCYRMLGSPFEAEDAVQETMVRAWRSRDRFERRASLRTWLHAIATNVCLDMLRSAQRRALPMDLGAAASAGSALGSPLPEARWVLPIPDRLVVDDAADPAQAVLARESIRLALVAALQQLPPRQRAALLLREVLEWRSEEIASLLGTSVPAVNSALQRARSTLATRNLTPADLLAPADPAQRELLERYVDAFERADVRALVALLHEDATMSMPPFAWWLRGRVQIERALAGSDACREARLLPTAANGLPAFGQYRRQESGGTLDPFALVVLEVADGSIRRITNHLFGARLFALFDLPARLR